MLHVFSDASALADAAVARTLELLQVFDRERPLLIGLAGGSTPELYYERLAMADREKISWERVHFFWGDERMVPSTDERSNVHMAEQSLISRIPVPPEQIHRPDTEGLSAEEAAEAYEADLRHTLAETAHGGLDLLLLGLGEDGHTASLFPGTSVLDEKEAWVRSATAPPGVEVTSRITLTLPLINASRHVIFLVSGSRKAPALASVLESAEDDTFALPAARVSARETLDFFADEAAADRAHK